MTTDEKRVIHYILKQRGPLITGILCASVVAGVKLGVGFLIKEALDSLQRSSAADLPKNIAHLNFIAVVVVGVFIINYFAAFGQTYSLGLVANSVAADLREAIFARIQKFSLSFYEKHRTGWFQSLVSNDVSVVQNGAMLVRDFVIAPVQVVGGLVILFITSWKLSLVVLVCLPLVANFIQRIGRRVRVIQSRVQGKLADLTSVVEECVNGVRVVKSFAREDYEVERFNSESRETLKQIMRGIKRAAQLKPTTELIGALAIMFSFWYGGRLVLASGMGVGDLFKFIYILNTVALAAGSVGSLNITRQQVLAAAERIFAQAIDIEPDIVDAPDAKVMPRVNGEVVFENVSFVYPDGNIAVQDVSFTINPDEVVALVGFSGAGKSTLMDLMMRFYDVSKGRILVGGYDIREVTQKSLREQIGVVPQQTMLFARSIRDNIRYGKEGATDEEVEAASKAAYSHDFIMEKELGYETLLGERGAAVSGGEAQRIAIARAVLKNPPILVLDEATSSLDAVSERSVQLALENTISNRTTIMIAHRLSTAKRADRILVMKEGCLVESGTHDELLRQDGLYARMYRAFEHGVISSQLD
ncbi:MAG: ABC transporter ATP-binding protein [bacterium]